MECDGCGFDLQILNHFCTSCLEKITDRLISEFLEDLNKCNIHNYPKELDNIIKKWEERLDEG